MSKSKNVTVFPQNIIKTDVSRQVFRYFRGLIEENCLEDNFVKQNLQAISNIF